MQSPANSSKGLFDAFDPNNGARGEERPAPPPQGSPVSLAVTDRVSFDLEQGGEPLGRVVVGLYGEDTPRTAENFKQLATGEQVRRSVLIGAKADRLMPRAYTCQVDC